MKAIELLKKPKSFIVLFLALALPVTLLMTKQVQDIRQRAQVPSGNLSNTPTPPKMSLTPPQTTISCDLNNDNITDVSDFATLYYCATGSDLCTQKQYELADINNTGRIESSDITRYSHTCVLAKPISPIPSGVPATPSAQPSYMPKPTYTPVRMSATPSRSNSKPPSPAISSTSEKKIFGLVYIDANKNGKRDSNENGYSGAKVTIHTAAYKLICTTATSSSGSYSCMIPSAGTYIVRLLIVPEYSVSSKNPVTITIPESIPSAGITFSVVH